MKTRLGIRACLVFCLLTLAHAQWGPLNPVVNAEQTTDGVVFKMQSGLMKLQVCSESVVRVIYSPGIEFPNRK